MSIDLTEESKNSLSMSLTSKDTGLTWAETDPETWGEQSGTWAVPGTNIIEEDKNSLSMTLEDKN